MNQHNTIAHALLDLGEAMIMNGLEVDRVERSLSKVGATYNLANVELLFLNGGMAITLTFPDENKETQIRRMAEARGVNCTKAELLEHLVKDCVKNPIPAKELSTRVAEICNQSDSVVGEYVGSVIGVAGLTIAFGGRPQDALVAAGIAVVVAFVRHRFKSFFPNTLIFNTIAALVAGLLACGAQALFGGLLLDKIMSGIVMMLIPGMAFTLAMREVFMGSTATGTMRLVEAVLWGLGLAFGFVASLAITGVYTEIAPNLNLEGWGFIIKLGTAYASAFGFGLMNHLPVRYLTAAPVVGMVSCGICVFLTQTTGNMVIANFVAGGFAVLCSNLLSLYFDTSSISIIVPAIMPLVPGSYLFYAMCCGLAGDINLFASNAQSMLVVALSLSAGMCAIWAVQAMARQVAASRSSKSS